MENTEKTMEKIVALCKNRGFVFPGSEIYGGLANSWDYGPLGVEFKNNVKRAWLRKFVQESTTNVGLDSAILMNREVWVASGHVTTFNDPLIDCKACKMRHRADNLIEGFLKDAAVAKIMYDAEKNRKGEPSPYMRFDAMTADELIAAARPIKTPFSEAESGEIYASPLTKEEMKKRNLPEKNKEGEKTPLSTPLVPR